MGNQCNFFPWAWPSRFPPAIECLVWDIAITWKCESLTTASLKCKLVKSFFSSIWFTDYYLSGFKPVTTKKKEDGELNLNSCWFTILTITLVGKDCVLEFNMLIWQIKKEIHKCFIAVKLNHRKPSKVAYNSPPPISPNW